MAGGDAGTVILDQVALEDPGRTPPSPPGLDDGGWGGPSGRAREPVVSNVTIAMLVFLTFEAMLFAGMVGAFIILRTRSGAWPPPGQPYLPLPLTWANTGVLLFSGYSMRRALRAIRQDDGPGLARWLLVTGIYGTTFLCIQGYEWLGLIRHGLTLSSSSYGSIFYVLIGTHGLHVLGAICWLLAVLALARLRRFSARRHTAVKACGMYWHFVVAVWPFLFVLVYLL